MADELPPEEYRTRLITAASFLNAAVTAFDVQREVRDLVGSDVGVAYGVYNVARSRVSALPLTDDGSSTPTFGSAPASADGLTKLAEEIAARLRDVDRNQQTVYLS